MFYIHARLRQQPELTPMGIGNRLEGSNLIRPFPKMHRHQQVRMQTLHKLGGSPHEITSQAGVYRKECQVDVRGLTCQQLQFVQIHFLRTCHLLWGRFILPVPIIQIACMKQHLVSQRHPERDTHIGRTKRLHLQPFIRIGVSLLQPIGLVLSGPTMFQDIFREEIVNIGLTLLPRQHLRIEMVGMEMGCQDIQRSRPVQQVLRDVTARRLPIRIAEEVEKQAKAIRLDGKTTVIDVSESHLQASF